MTHFRKKSMFFVWHISLRKPSIEPSKETDKYSPSTERGKHTTLRAPLDVAVQYLSIPVGWEEEEEVEEESV